MSPPPKRSSARLFLLALRKAGSWAALARRMGVTVQTVWLWRTGRRQMSALTREWLEGYIR